MKSRLIIIYPKSSIKPENIYKKKNKCIHIMISDYLYA